MANKKESFKENSIFYKTFLIRGKHANMVRDMTAKLDCRNVDVFYISIVLGLEYKKSAQEDCDSSIEPAKIDAEQMNRLDEDIQFLYRLTLLADEDYCPSAQKRSDKAFRSDAETMVQDQKHFVQVFLGGLEFFHEKIQAKPDDSESVFGDLWKLVENFHDKHPGIKEEDFLEK